MVLHRLVETAPFCGRFTYADRVKLQFCGKLIAMYRVMIFRLLIAFNLILIGHRQPLQGETGMTKD
jgi:hypothetical protein